MKNKKKAGAPLGNQNAIKPDGEKISGKGRITVDLGQLLKNRLLDHVKKSKKETIKSFIVKSLEKYLK